MPMPPIEPIGLLGGAFVAFFAYIGFESMVNLAEEVKKPERTLPRALLAAIGIAAALYALVSAIAVLVMSPAQLADEPAALTALVQLSLGSEPVLFTTLALSATANGVLIEIVGVSRLLYGMAHRKLVPGWFGIAHSRTHVPVRATLFSGALWTVLVAAVPFEALVTATSTLTLVVFLLVNLSLFRLKRQTPASSNKPAFELPLALPLITALLCGTLIVMGLFAEN
jgi:basic amino acid/polyamine antiporter, APA family